MKFTNPHMTELSAKVAADISKVKYKQYGKYLGDFVVGETYEHPRSMTVSAGFIHDFATTFLEYIRNYSPLGPTEPSTSPV